MLSKKKLENVFKQLEESITVENLEKLLSHIEGQNKKIDALNNEKVEIKAKLEKIDAEFKKMAGD